LSVLAQNRRYSLSFRISSLEKTARKFSQHTILT